MLSALKWLFGFGLVIALALGAGLYFALQSGAGPSDTTAYSAPSPVAIYPSPSPGFTSIPTPIILPAAVKLPVPYTDQAPTGDWKDSQHTCEEASLTMVDLYLRGNHSGGQIDAQAANAMIQKISAWKPTLDMTNVELGQLASQYLGWAYQVLPADRQHIMEQLALGRPVIVGVRTHGLGNPIYPGYTTHYEQPGWSVSHYLVVVGYDQQDTVILNDPGITRGHGYHIKFDQLFHAIDDLDQAYPNLNEGRVILVLAPAA